ncbi:2TM domain-containing protein [Aestuariibaculum sp. M13]|uniref:2TM domain-containing protein n=1 Tax=Aestuariibaculum sp. M13 TaxID=2967132 RepID=UPI002159C54F|nr:2TM domain-containing protein [Aestuariibaculum sp. M13]MCR8668512.1 2TM domain-containing protein [Aestuariibaculum sp. M13]
MSADNRNQEAFLKAEKKVYNLKVFYIHLVGYFILVALLVYNLYIMHGPYKDFFFWFDIIVLVAWTVFISIHGRHVFRGEIIFKKNWEERKIKEFLEKDRINRWE